MISDWLDVVQEQSGQYDAWDETINPPRPWHCRDCNGIGYFPDTWPCQVCKETGIRWAWLRWLKKIVKSLRTNLRLFAWHYFHVCAGCEKFKSFLCFRICQHNNCLPF